jgi:hypothetical protein
VHVIRHLPRLTPDERARVEHSMPRSVDAVRQEIEEETFLNGGETPPSAHTGH